MALIVLIINRPVQVSEWDTAIAAGTLYGGMYCTGMYSQYKLRNRHRDCLT